MGLENIMDLYRDVPEQMLLRKPLNIPDGMSELEASRAVSAMAAENRTYATVLRGAGAYDHYIPSIVKYIPAKEEFLTAYTPYQAEMSQGLLQSIFEYQTMICELTGMDVANASVYDGASAAAEAVASGRCEKGIVICTTGIGISIAANKVKGIRCAHCADSLEAEMTRRHNDANMMAIGAGFTGKNLAERMVEVFLSTEFEGGRHARRVNKLDAIQP